MDHADPRTTPAYDRDRHNLDRDAAITVSARDAQRRRRSARPRGHATSRRSPARGTMIIRIKSDHGQLKREPAGADGDRN
jgi:hypothetical protein